MDSVIYILLNFLNGCIQEDTNTAIARTILNHIYDFQGYSLAKASEVCNVSESTMKRFCIEVGFSSYSHLRKMCKMYEKIDPPMEHDVKMMNLNYNTIEAIDPKEIRKVNQMIYYSKKAVIIGYGNFQYAAMYYQKQLFSLGKLIEVCHIYPDSNFKVKDADLLIVVSMKGRFLKDNYEWITHYPHKVLITQCKEEYDFDTIFHLGEPTLDIYEKYDLLHIFDLLLNDYKKIE